MLIAHYYFSYDISFDLPFTSWQLNGRRSISRRLIKPHFVQLWYKLLFDLDMVALFMKNPLIVYPRFFKNHLFDFCFMVFYLLQRYSFMSFAAKNDYICYINMILCNWSFRLLCYTISNIQETINKIANAACRK